MSELDRPRSSSRGSSVGTSMHDAIVFLKAASEASTMIEKVECFLDMAQLWYTNNSDEQLAAFAPHIPLILRFVLDDNVRIALPALRTLAFISANHTLHRELISQGALHRCIATIRLTQDGSLWEAALVVLNQIVWEEPTDYFEKHEQITVFFKNDDNLKPVLWCAFENMSAISILSNGFALLGKIVNRRPDIQHVCALTGVIEKAYHLSHIHQDPAVRKNTKIFLNHMGLGRYPFAVFDEMTLHVVQIMGCPSHGLTYTIWKLVNAGEVATQKLAWDREELIPRIFQLADNADFQASVEEHKKLCRREHFFSAMDDDDKSPPFSAASSAESSSVAPSGVACSSLSRDKDALKAQLRDLAGAAEMGDDKARQTESDSAESSEEDIPGRPDRRPSYGYGLYEEKGDRGRPTAATAARLEAEAAEKYGSDDDGPPGGLTQLGEPMDIGAAVVVRRTATTVTFEDPPTAESAGGDSEIVPLKSIEVDGWPSRDAVHKRTDTFADDTVDIDALLGVPPTMIDDLPPDPTITDVSAAGSSAFAAADIAASSTDLNPAVESDAADGAAGAASVAGGSIAGASAHSGSAEDSSVSAAVDVSSSVAGVSPLTSDPTPVPSQSPAPLEKTSTLVNLARSGYHRDVAPYFPRIKTQTKIIPPPVLDDIPPEETKSVPLKSVQSESNYRKRAHTTDEPSSSSASGKPTLSSTDSDRPATVRAESLTAASFSVDMKSRSDGECKSSDERDSFTSPSKSVASGVPLLTKPRRSDRMEVPGSFDRVLSAPVTGDSGSKSLRDRRVSDVAPLEVDSSYEESRKIHIAVLQANPLLPDSADVLQLESETRKLELIFRQPKKSVNYYRGVLTRDGLMHVIGRDAQIVHISGHGFPSDELQFETRFGKIDKVHGSFIAESIKKSTSNSLKVVFVAMCYSSAIAQHFSEAGVPHVIAIAESAQIGDNIAIEFAEFFYQSLYVEQNTVYQSFRNAQAKVHLNHTERDCCCRHGGHTPDCLCPACGAYSCCPIHHSRKTSLCPMVSSEDEMQCCNPDAPHYPHEKFVLLPEDDPHSEYVLRLGAAASSMSSLSGAASSAIVSETGSPVRLHLDSDPSSTSSSGIPLGSPDIAHDSSAMISCVEKFVKKGEFSEVSPEVKTNIVKTDSFHFIGRVGYVQNMVAHILPDHAAAIARVFVLYGDKGVGTTSVSLTVARFFIRPWTKQPFPGGVYYINMNPWNVIDTVPLVSYIARSMALDIDSGFFYATDMAGNEHRYPPSIQKRLHSGQLATQLDLIDYSDPGTLRYLIVRKPSPREVSKVKPKVGDMIWGKIEKLGNHWFPLEVWEDADLHEADFRRVMYHQTPDEEVLKQISKHCTGNSLFILDDFNEKFGRDDLRIFLDEFNQLEHYIPTAKFLLVFSRQLNSMLTKFEKEYKIRFRCIKLDPINQGQAYSLLRFLSRPLDQEWDLSRMDPKPTSDEELLQEALFVLMARSPGLIDRCANVLNDGLPLAVLFRCADQPDHWNWLLEHYKKDIIDRGKDYSIIVDKLKELARLFQAVRALCLESARSADHS